MPYDLWRYNGATAVNDWIVKDLYPLYVRATDGFHHTPAELGQAIVADGRSVVNTGGIAAPGKGPCN